MLLVTCKAPHVFKNFNYEVLKLVTETNLEFGIGLNGISKLLTSTNFRHYSRKISLSYDVLSQEV